MRKRTGVSLGLAIAMGVLSSFGCGAVSSSHLLVPPSERSVQQAQPVQSMDQHFVSTLASGNSAEIMLARLALQHSRNRQVRDFARRMIRDHNQAGQSFAQAASTAGIFVQESLTPEQLQEQQQLSQLQGHDFDRAYMAQALQDHVQTMALLRQEIAQGQELSLVNFARETLPTVRSHLREARRVAASVGVSGNRAQSPFER